MDQLTKLIIEYEKETGYSSMNWEGGFSIQFVEWLASKITDSDTKSEEMAYVEVDTRGTN